MQVYTTKEAAEILKASQETVRLWFREGLLRGTKSGGKSWRTTDKAVYEFLKKGEPQQTA